jgi:hypothetical protein
LITWLILNRYFKHILNAFSSPPHLSIICPLARH